MQPCHRIHLSHRDLLTPSIANHSNDKHNNYTTNSLTAREPGERTRSLQTLFDGNKIRNKNTAVLSQSPRRGHQQFCFLFHSHKILFCSHKILLRSLKTLFWSLEGTEKYFDRRTSAENHQYLDTGDFFLISFPRTTIVFPQDSISRK